MSRHLQYAARIGWTKTDLSVEVEQIESEEMNLDFDVFLLDVLSLSSAELLEWQQPLLLRIPRHGLAIDDERSRSLLDALRDPSSALFIPFARDREKRTYSRELRNDIGILDAHIF